MKIGEKDILINGKSIKAKITIKEAGDRELLKNLYSDWKKLNDRLKAISTRGINLPETISEKCSSEVGFSRRNGFRDHFRHTKTFGVGVWRVTVVD